MPDQQSGGAGGGGVIVGSGGITGTGGSGSGGVGTGGVGTGGSATGGSGTGGAATGGSGTGGRGTGGAGTAGTGTGGTATGGSGTGGRGTGGAGTGGAATGGSGTGGRGTGGSGTGGAGTGGAATGGRGTGGAGTGGAATDSAHYNFESSVQSWAMATGSAAFTSIARDTSRRFMGQSSLAAGIAATAAATYQLSVIPSPAIPAGATVTFHIFIPTGAALDWIQPYVQEVGPAYTWTGNYAQPPPTFGAWTTLTVSVPAAANIGALGVQFHTSAAWTGTVYVDSVGW